MIDLTTILTQAFANLISGLIANIVYILIAIWGFRLVAREIKEGVKQMPNWINQFFIEQQKARTLDRVLESRR